MVNSEVEKITRTVHWGLEQQMRNNLSTWLLFTATILFFAACGGGGSDKSEIEVENNNSGALTLSLLDAPTEDYNAVYVTVRTVRVHEKGGRWHHVASPHTTCNLLELVGGLRQHLGIVDLDEGDYNQLRIILGETPDDGINILSETHPFANYLIDSANDYQELKVPSGFKSGIKVIHGFRIGENETTDLILDFDASQSIVKAGNSGKWLLKPVIRVLTENDAAVIKGRVDDPSGGAIESATVSAQVHDPNASDPMERVKVVASSLSNGSGDYAIILQPGTYNLVAVKAGLTPASRQLEVLPDTILHEDFTLDVANTGTIGGTVSITGGSWEQYASLSFRKDGEIEVAFVSVAHDGDYTVELAEGTYTVVAFTYGWTTQEHQTTVTDGSTTTLDITF